MYVHIWVDIYAITNPSGTTVMKTEVLFAALDSTQLKKRCM